MRIALAGAMPSMAPIILKFTEHGVWNPASYVDAGYTNYDVICIGGGGGRGGDYRGLDFVHPVTTKLHSYGGKGGGGGFHRVQGLLAALLGLGLVEIIVGSGGAPGTDLLTNALVASNIPTTDGAAGGVTQFGNLCFASGGNGGKRVYSATVDGSPDCQGGDGGLGGITEPGWGGQHGEAGTLADLGPAPGTPGEDGTLLYGPFEYTTGFLTLPGFIGKGGGGGAGGIVIFDPALPDSTGSVRMKATAGGKGAYDPSDESVFGYGSPATDDPNSPNSGVVSGLASGARTSPLDGTTTVYGRSASPGIIALRLTADE